MIITPQTDPIYVSINKAYYWFVPEEDVRYKPEKPQHTPKIKDKWKGKPTSFKSALKDIGIEYNSY